MRKSIKSNKYFIMMRGVPGAGKSTFAQAVAGALPAVVIENDVIKDHIVKLLKVRRPNKRIRIASHLASHELLSRNINVGFSIVFDSCALSLNDYRSCKKLVSKKYRFIVCECYCPDLNILHERLKKRKYPWQESNLRKILKDLEKMDILPTRRVIKIDTGQPIKDNVIKFLKFIKKSCQK